MSSYFAYAICHLLFSGRLRHENYVSKIQVQKAHANAIVILLFEPAGTYNRSSSSRFRILLPSLFESSSTP